VLARIRTPAPRERNAGCIRHEEAGFPDDVGVGLAVEPGRAAACAEGECEPAIPSAVEPVTRPLRARGRTKRRKDEDRTDDHP